MPKEDSQTMAKHLDDSGGPNIPGSSHPESSTSNPSDTLHVNQGVLMQMQGGGSATVNQGANTLNMTLLDQQVVSPHEVATELIAVPSDPEQARIVAGVRKAIDTLFPVAQKELFHRIDHIQPIGKGAMGQAYYAVAHFGNDRKEIVLKLVDPNPQDPTLLPRLMREGKTMIELGHEHEAMLTGYQVIPTGHEGVPGIPNSANKYLIVTEHIRGIDLSKMDEVYRAIKTSTLFPRSKIKKGDIFKNLFVIYGRIDLNTLKDLQLSRGNKFSELLEDETLSKEDEKTVFAFLEKEHTRSTLRIIIDILKALELAHEYNIAHRDLKPANIMIDRQRRTRLIDFGLSDYIYRDEKRTQTAKVPKKTKAFKTDRKLKRTTLLESLGQEEKLRTPTASGPDAKLSAEGHIVGTPYYMAPYIVNALGNEAKRKIPGDIYAVGMMAHEFLAGELPYTSTTHDERSIISEISRLHTSFKLEDSLPNIDPKLSAIVNKMLAITPEAGYKSAHEPRKDLETYLASLNQQP